MSSPQYPQNPQQPPYGGPPQGYPGPQGFAPQGHPQPPAPQKKKGFPLWAWLLIGFFVLCFMVGGAVIVAGWYVVGKVADAGKNPVAAMVRLAAAANPDIEVLDVNETTGKVTIRDKRNGKTVTIDADQMTSEGKFTIESDEGKAVFGSGAAIKAPDWVIVPSGVSLTGGITQESNGELSGSITFTAKSSIDELKKTLEDSYRSQGYELKGTFATSGGEGQGLQMTFEHEGRGRSVAVHAAQSSDGLGGTFIYTEKRGRSN